MGSTMNYGKLIAQEVQKIKEAEEGQKLATSVIFFALFKPVVRRRNVTR